MTRGMSPTQAVVAAVLLLVAKVTTAGSETPPLSRMDFVVAGLVEGMNSSAAERVMGRPDSVKAIDDFRDPGAKLISWVYRDLVVMLGSSDRLRGVLITGRRVPTARGLRVGDRRERVAELYGVPIHQDARVAEYADPDQQLHGITVLFRGAVVTEIFIGWAID